MKFHRQTHATARCGARARSPTPTAASDINIQRRIIQRLMVLLLVCRTRPWRKVAVKANASFKLQSVDAGGGVAH
jgi:hypothetical protein